MAIEDAEVLKAATALGVVGGNSQSAHRLLAALCDPTLGMDQIAAIVRQEPGLTVRVLKVANSAYYGRSGQVPSVDRALMVLGLDSVRGIAAAACLDRSVLRRGDMAPIQPEALVTHCVASAIAAESLARIARPGLSGEAMIAGLLHDFGVLVQERLDPTGVSALINALRTEADTPTEELRARHVRVSAAHCARVVFEAWRLPSILVDAVRFVDDPGQAPEGARDLALLLHLGVRVATDAGFVHPLRPRTAATPPQPALDALSLEASALQTVGERLAEQVLLLRGVG